MKTSLSRDFINKRGGAAGWILGCLGAIVVVIAAIILVAYLLRDSFKPQPLPEDKRAFAGEWEGEDGTRMIIQMDGTGTYHSVNIKIQGGLVNFDPGKNTVTIGFGPVNKTMSIDEPPGPIHGGMQMKLGGTIFRRLTRTQTLEDTPAAEAGIAPVRPLTELPSSPEVEQWCREVLGGLSQALETDDFGSFYGSLARRWQEQTTPLQLRASFAPLQEQAPRIKPAAAVRAKFRTSPGLDDNGLLVAEGHFPAENQRLYFRIKFTREAGEWRPTGIHVKLENPE